MVMIDMDMPQDCDLCHFGYEDYITKKSGCDLMDCLPNSPDCNAYTPMGQREKNCPLREVPGKEERPKGRWKRQLVDSGFSADWHCSECGWKTALEEHGYNFCPNCGANMGAV